jgi:hypothetical protein
MMIAEIGLPPAADVDRESLEQTGLRYEVRPDRVLFYVWPSAQGTAFNFAFRVRYGLSICVPRALWN